MRSSAARERKSIALVVGVLVVVVIAAIGGLSLLLGGDGGTTPRTRSTVPRSVSTTRATTTTTRPPTLYRVQRGDTLSGIARRFGVTVAMLVLANRISDPGHLAEGATLLVPPPPPIALAVTPAVVTGGDNVQLRLTGAKPFETVRFEVDSPKAAFHGPPHRASSEGVVTATYYPAPESPVGTYTVIATGNEGTTARATFTFRA